MASSVYFKFRSWKEPKMVGFDGTGISVFELKRDIILKHCGPGDGTDFDLTIFNEDGSEEYDDDTTVIPRSTTVIASRRPAMKAGAGRAARYITGKMPVSAKNSSRREQAIKTSAKAASNAIVQMNNASTEEEKMNAMFAAQKEQWTAQQEDMSHQTPIFKPGSKKPVNVPDHEPPNGYVCHRCGEKGHWIQQCPTNDNPEFDNRPRVKRTTGIPKSFLKTVDKNTILAQAGDDDAKIPSAIMVNADGDFVIAEPDKATWDKYQAQTKSSAAAQKIAALGEKELQDRGLECDLDKKMFIDPMKTPCCAKTYCNDCITNALIEGDLVCPGCQTEGVLIDDLKSDDETTTKIEAYMKEKSDAAKEKARSKSPEDAKSPAADATQETPADNQTGTDKARKLKSPTPPTSVKSPTAQGSPKTAVATKEGTPTANGALTISKKRPAEDVAENPTVKIPTGPKALQKAQDVPQLPGNMMDMMNAMGGMPGMPGLPGMSSMPGMPGFPMGMPMGMMPPMPPMMMGAFNNMNGFPPMMTQQMNPMMNGFNPGPNMSGFQGQMNGNTGYGNNGFMNGGINGGGHNMNGGHNIMHGAGQMNGGGPGLYNQNPRVPNFTQPNNADEDAYFRKPVNPHRHQSRQRRVRPSDYREL